MIKVIRETASRGTHIYEINGVNFSFRWTPKRISDLNDAVKNIEDALKRNDISSLSAIFATFPMNYALLIADSLFKKEYINFIKNVCCELSKMKNVVFLHDVFDCIRYGTFDLSTVSKRTNFVESYATVSTTIIDTLNDFKDDLFNQIIAHITEKEHQEVCCKLCFFSNIEIIKRLLLIDQNILYEYLTFCSDELFSNNEKLSWIKLLNHSIFNKKEYPSVSNDVAKVLKESDNIFKKVIVDIKEKKMDDIKKKKYSIKDDVWVLNWTDVNNIRSATLDFSSLPYTLKNEAKMYFDNIVKHHKSYRKLSSRLQGIKKVIDILLELHYNIESSLDINRHHVEHLFDDFQKRKNNQTNSHYKLSTIRTFFTEMRLFLDWVIENLPEHDRIENPFRRMQFNNVSSFVDHKDYIPEEVVEQISKYQSELPQNARNAWVIMMNSGMRISDVFNLREDCFYYDKNLSSWILSYQPVKNDNSRRKLGFEKMHKIPIEEFVVGVLKEQIESTAEYRMLSNSDKIFLSKNYHSISQPQPQFLSNKINELIKKHKIVDSNGDNFHYTHHQCRKTLAVDMLSSGSTLDEVADFLAHSSTKTTSVYYKDIEIKKMAELESNYFDEIFSDLVDDEIKDLYSEEEKKSLFKEIKLGARETPEGHGTCIKHVSFGPCMKKSCVGCKMLTTGPQKLPKWYELYNEQKEYIESLKNEYIEQNIDDFENHRVFQRENQLLNIYKDTIEKVEDFANKRGIKIDKQ